MIIQKLSDGSYRVKQMDIDMQVRKDSGRLSTTNSSALYIDKNQMKLMDGGKMRWSGSLPKEFNVSALSNKIFNIIKKEVVYKTLEVKTKDVENFLRKYIKAQG